MLKGLPVWTVMVGPPASGKTLIVDTLDMIPRVHPVDMVKSPGALLSGVAKKDVAKGATGGLLRQIGDMGIISIKDFTTMMSLPRDPLMEVIGAFRRIFDGKWNRQVGTDGGRLLEWSGHVGLISACTSVIDRHHQLLSELGERWVYYRYTESDGYGETKSALKCKDPAGVMKRMRELVAEFMETAGVEWCEGGMDRRELEDQESNKLYSQASLIAAARSPVQRDYHTREISDVKETESPTRLAGSLGQLYLGLEAIGLDESARWRVVGKAALDSMPGIRLELVNSLRTGAKRPGELKEAVGCSAGTVRHVCEDLEMHGVIERVGKGDRMGEGTGSWRLSQWTNKQLSQGWGGTK